MSREILAADETSIDFALNVIEPDWEAFQRGYPFLSHWTTDDAIEELEEVLSINYLGLMMGLKKFYVSLTPEEKPDLEFYVFGEPTLPRLSVQLLEKRGFINKSLPMDLDELSTSRRWLQELEERGIKHPFREANQHLPTNDILIENAIMIPHNWALLRFHAKHGGIERTGGTVIILSGNSTLGGCREEYRNGKLLRRDVHPGACPSSSSKQM